MQVRLTCDTQLDAVSTGRDHLCDKGRTNTPKDQMTETKLTKPQE